MRWALSALGTLGAAYAALEMPALRWADDPLGNDALLAFVSDVPARGTWESVTADGRAVCLGPPLTAANFAIAPARLARLARAQPMWPGIAETVTDDAAAARAMLPEPAAFGGGPIVLGFSRAGRRTAAP